MLRALNRSALSVSAALLLFALFSCAVSFKEPVTVIRQPVSLDEQRGVRPVVWFSTIPEQYTFFELPVMTNRGEWKLSTAVTAVDSYRHATEAFFSLTPRAKYADYYAILNLDIMSFGGNYETVGSTVKATYQFNHVFTIYKTDLNFQDSIELDIMYQSEFPVPAPRDAADVHARDSARALGEILKQAEINILSYLVENDYPGKYIIPRNEAPR